MRRATAMGCVAVIAVADHVIKRRNPPWLVVGMFDHPAHVATAMLLRRRWSAPYLIGSLLPDVDHIPFALQPVHPSPGDPRPVSHCLISIAPVAAVSREAAAGMLAHYVRDLGVGTGAPLLWPLTRWHVKLPYAAYAVLVLAAAYSRSCPSGAAPAHIPGASGRGP